MKLNKLLIALTSLTLLAGNALAQTPEGWKQRIDRSTNASDPDAEGDVKLQKLENGDFHIETPSAAVFWHPENTASGTYTLKGTFTLNEPSSHANYYGLVFGGNALEGGEQRYTYFVVAQNGSWLVKTRDGNQTKAAFDDVPGAGRNGSVRHDAVKTPDDTGKSVNALEVRVKEEQVEFVINGTVVHSALKAGLTTDGIWGIRSNHQLNINVSDFGKTE